MCLLSMLYLSAHAAVCILIERIESVRRAFRVSNPAIKHLFSYLRYFLLKVLHDHLMLEKCIQFMEGHGLSIYIPVQDL
jgi:hypothetical protein